MEKGEPVLLLENPEKMILKSGCYAPSGSGYEPMKRPMRKYLDYGTVVIDKPSNPSSHEVTTWVKEILELEKTGHSGTLDPKVTGVLSICLNRATRLVKSQQNAGKEYICVIEFRKETTRNDLENAIKKLTGHLYQRPPLMCAVKREIRLRWIYRIDLIEFEPKKALFRVACEAGTYIRSLCTHIGLYIGCGAEMKDLRRVKSGFIEEDECVTLHDLQDAYWIYKNTGEEKYLRKVVKPVESILRHYPRIMVKDSAINSICYGGQLTAKGIIKYDPEIEAGKEGILISPKGEAVALIVFLVSACQLKDIESGIVAKTKRVIMEKDLYPRMWGIKDDYEIIDSNSECE